MQFIQLIDSWDLGLRSWASSLGPTVEGLLRLVLAGALGGLVGLERELRGRQAGFRTYLLVCLGSALVMVVSTEFGMRVWKSPPPGVNINIDPARIAYGVMTGVGFLGAGVIVHNKGSVRGLTTAAGLWCIAGVGLSAGFGMYLLTILASLLILIALWILDYFEDWLPRLRYRTVVLRTRYEPGCVAEAVKRFKSNKMRVIDASFERIDGLDRAEIHLRIAFTDPHDYYHFERKLEGDSTYQLIATREM